MGWLVTGGAGYIGAHVVRGLQDAGHDVLVLDDLTSGRREFLDPDVPLVEGSVCDPDVVGDALRSGVDGVVHVAGLKYAGESVGRPLDFYRVNVEGTRVLLEQCRAAGVTRFVFSSSAAVFGTPDVDLVTEGTPRVPESPYGESKLVGEWLVAAAARAQRLAGGPELHHTSLRYFNVAGSGIPGVVDLSPFNLVPLLLRALSEGRPATVFGDDYDTPDGTCVRDYIHVSDVAAAHVAAVRALLAGRPLAPAYNLGRGEGVSVLQVIDAVGAVVGRPVPYEVAPRRDGDPARIVTATDRARADLGWAAHEDLSSMAASAWHAWCSWSTRVRA